jgi:hypothetical protein
MAIAHVLIQHGSPCVSVYMHTCVWMYACLCTCIPQHSCSVYRSSVSPFGRERSVCVCVCLCVRVCVCVHIPASLCLCVCACVHTFKYACVHVQWSLDYPQTLGDINTNSVKIESVDNSKQSVSHSYSAIDLFSDNRG